MTSSQARQLAGKRISWSPIDNSRRMFVRADRSGLVDEVRGKNIRIDGEWHWIPDMRNIAVLDDKSEPTP